jgi:hypothetical protein
MGAMRWVGLALCIAAFAGVGMSCNRSAARAAGSNAASRAGSSDSGIAPATRPAQIPFVYAPGVAHFWVGREEQLCNIARQSEPPGQHAWFIYVHASRHRADIFFSPEQSTPRLRKGQFCQVLGDGMLGFDLKGRLGHQDYMQVSPSASEPFGSELSAPDGSVLSLPVVTDVLTLAPGSVSDEAFVSILDMVRGHLNDVWDPGDGLLAIGVDGENNVVIDFGDDRLYPASLHFRRLRDGRYVYALR